MPTPQILTKQFDSGDISKIRTHKSVITHELLYYITGFSQLVGWVNDKTWDILLCCRRKSSPIEKICGNSAKLEKEKRVKETGSVPNPKKAPEGSWPNGNEPQGFHPLFHRVCKCLWKPQRQGDVELFKPVFWFCRLYTALLSVCCCRATRPQLRLRETLCDSFRFVWVPGQSVHRLRWQHQRASHDIWKQTSFFSKPLVLVIKTT